MDATRATGIPNSSISLCLSGTLTHAGGFGWRSSGSGGAAAASGNKAISKKPSTSSQQQSTGKKSRGVHPRAMSAEQYDLASGRTIARFDSQGDAARATGIDQGGISSVINGDKSHAGGFGWRRPGTAALAAAASENAATTAAARTTSGGAIPSRFQRSDPYNVSLSKGTINSNSNPIP